MRSDLRKALDAIVPGTSAADACARASFVGVSLDIPVRDGRLALGTWQGLYLCGWQGLAQADIARRVTQRILSHRSVCYGKGCTSVNGRASARHMFIAVSPNAF